MGPDDDGFATLTGSNAPPPTQIGSFRVDAEIARGARCFVLRAWDASTERAVALKVARDIDDDGFADELLRAAGRAQAVESAAVVPVWGTGRVGRFVYVASELVGGDDLDTIVRRDQALVPGAALRSILDAASGLQAAVELGLTHGDLRPRHLLRTRGQTRLIGFGQSPARRTQLGRLLLGDPAYLAPECIAGMRADFRADIYALGCTLFELLVGRVPYAGAGGDGLLACHVHEPFPTLASAGLKAPAPLEAFLQRLVHKSAERRFQSYVEILQLGAELLPKLRRLIPSEPALVVEEGRQVGERFPLLDGETTIGREAGVGILVDDGRASRRHAAIRVKDGAVEVVDLDSRNGVRVNGYAVRRQLLEIGDRLEVGETVFRLRGSAPIAAGSPGALPASPLRGADAESEVVHGPQQQADVQAVADLNPEAAALRLRFLADVAPLLIAPGAGATALDEALLAAAKRATGAERALRVPVDGDRLRLDAASAEEAQTLSCVMPALDRALPGSLSLLTSVRVGKDRHWRVALAPVRQSGTVTRVLVLVCTGRDFVPGSLELLEAACGLLALRA